jgi:hypothetical protein
VILILVKCISISNCKKLHFDEEKCENLSIVAEKCVNELATLFGSISPMYNLPLSRHLKINTRANYTQKSLKQTAHYLKVYMDKKA